MTTTIYTTQNDKIGAFVDDCGCGFILTFQHRNSRALMNGDALPDYAAKFDGKTYVTKRDAIKRANAVCSK